MVYFEAKKYKCIVRKSHPWNFILCALYTLMSVGIYCPYHSVYNSCVTGKGFFNNQELHKLMIISFILMTLMWVKL